MKERGRDYAGANIGNVRSAVEREKTKMRERQRRSITTNIFHGLRKHGGYRLSPRADINEVLRHLALEAGWIVDPDGTTYRSHAFSSVINACPMCGAGRNSALVTPSCSYLGGGAGDCSTAASPRRDSTVNILSSGRNPSLSGGSVIASNEGLLAVYMRSSALPVTACGKGQQAYASRDGTVSNQNAPA